MAGPAEAKRARGLLSVRVVVDVIGWLSSLILLATIIAQLKKQWSERATRGVSKGLFFGQAAASLGFTVYSVLVHNWVFVVTNALMFASAIVGCAVTLKFSKSNERASRSPHGVDAASRPSSAA
jgi:MtN3 and saliva related transmembrane protein